MGGLDHMWERREAEEYGSTGFWKIFSLATIAVTLIFIYATKPYCVNNFNLGQVVERISTGETAPITRCFKNYLFVDTGGEVEERWGAYGAKSVGGDYGS